MCVLGRVCYWLGGFGDFFCGVVGCWGVVVLYGCCGWYGYDGGIWVFVVVCCFFGIVVGVVWVLIGGD